MKRAILALDDGLLASRKESFTMSTVFYLHHQALCDYRDFVQSFVQIADGRLRVFIQQAIELFKPASPSLQKPAEKSCIACWN